MYRDRDGGFHATYVFSTSFTTVTVADSLTVPLDAGNDVWLFGETSRVSAVNLNLKASTASDWALRAAGGFDATIDRYNARTGRSEPLLVHVDNSTDAGAINWISGEYEIAAQ